MRILAALRLDEAQENLFVDDNVLYRPDLVARQTGALLRAIRIGRIDVLITEGSLLDRLSPQQWTELEASGIALVVLCEDDSWHAADWPYILHRVARKDAGACAERLAFEQAEHLHCSLLAADLPVGSALHAESCPSVLLVGAGIVNLITAWRLHRAGFRIALHERAPDPRRRRDPALQGCTFGGKDARIFSFNEARHHHHAGYLVDEQTGTQFQKSVAEQGWLARPPEPATPGEQAWTDAFERVSPWLSGIYNRDIIAFNRESQALWSTLRRDDPHLFDGVGYRERLLRLYQTRERLETGRTNEARIGALIREIDLPELSRIEPALRPAIAAERIVGAFEVHGFSLNVHQLGFRLLDALEADGVPITWNSELDEVILDRCRRVVGLRFGQHMRTADHYVLSLGAYGSGSIGEPVARGRIGAMIGMWATIPNLAPALETPLKVARRGYAAGGAAEGANIIPGMSPDGPVLHCSAGHGFLGLAADRLDDTALADLSRCVLETVEDLFPVQTSAAFGGGRPNTPLAYCVRPWTPSGLGVFDLRSTDRSGLLALTGGHNTGGFSQAPATAEAVLAAFQGRFHPMHALYHPDRFSGFVAL